MTDAVWVIPLVLIVLIAGSLFWYGFKNWRMTRGGK